MDSYKKFHQKLYQIFSQDTGLNTIPLEQILNSIPTVDHLKNVPPGTTVLIRADLDMPVKDDRVIDFSRIRATSPTIKYCISQGWKVIIFGHLGRDRNITLRPVCEGYKKEIEQDIVFIPDWLDMSEPKVLDHVISTVKEAKPGTAFMLENTRKYDEIERAMWNVSEEDFSNLCKKLYTLSMDFRNRLTEIMINEAIAASNFDFSSSVLPLVMSKTALGFYINEEMNEHIINARKANLVVISGLKINKLDDLEAILKRRTIKWVIAAGSLAMALKKAKAQLDGNDFFIGRAESDKNEKFYISPQRIEQGKRIVQLCIRNNIDLVLPTDFILDNEEIKDEIPEDRIQLDIGPKTIALYKKKISEYIDESKKSSQSFAMYYNGVFGKFEDPRFETGTREFISQLHKMTQSGILTYVGGGEGRLALLKYGDISDVTHAFTAGGTILKSLSDRHIQFLKAMYLQNKSITLSNK